MKSATAYYLLLIYLASTCKPLSVWLSDVVAHLFFEQEHITTVHRQHGKNHVHYQVAKTAGEEDPAKGSAPVKVIDEIYLPVQYHFQAHRFRVGVSYNGYSSAYLPFISLSIQLPPPKALRPDVLLWV